MKWMIYLFGLLIVWLPAPALAETWTLGGEADLSVMFNSRSKQHNDMVATTGLAAVADYGFGENVRLGFGAGIPLPVAPSVAVPLSARYFPFGWASSGVYVQAKLVPMWTPAAPCAFKGRDGAPCPIPGPDIDEGRLYYVVGAASEIGAGFHVVISDVWLYLDFAFNAGYFKGLETEGHAVVSGLYAGPELALGLRVELD